METPNCYMEEKVINDVTCTNTVEFSCQRVKTTKNDGYGQKRTDCIQTPKQDCYNIPRKVNCVFYFSFVNIDPALDPSGGVQNRCPQVL